MKDVEDGPLIPLAVINQEAIADLKKRVGRMEKLLALVAALEVVDFVAGPEAARELLALVLGG